MSTPYLQSGYLKRKGCSSSPVEFIYALRFVQVCLTAKNASNSRSIFSPRALLSALSSFMSSLSSLICLLVSALSSSMRWLSLASLALVSSQLTASSVATTPHAPGCAHSTRADGKDVNKESRLLFLEFSTQCRSWVCRLSLLEFYRQFPSEVACEEFIAQHGWGDTPQCPVVMPRRCTG